MRQSAAFLAISRKYLLKLSRLGLVPAHPSGLAPKDITVVLHFRADRSQSSSNLERLGGIKMGDQIDRAACAECDVCGFDPQHTPLAAEPIPGSGVSGVRFPKS
jgi:hypothetical protein